MRPWWRMASDLAVGASEVGARAADEAKEGWYGVAFDGLLGGGGGSAGGGAGSLANETTVNSERWQK